MSIKEGNKGNKGSKGTKGSYVPRYGTDLAGKTPRQQPTLDEKFNEVLNYYKERLGAPILPDVVHGMSLEDKQHAIDVYNEKIGKIHDKQRGILDPETDPVRPLITAEYNFIRKKAKEYGIKLDHPTMFDSFDWVNQKEKYFKIPDDELRRIAPDYAEKIIKAKAEYKPETQYAEQAVKEQANPEKSSEDKALNNVQTESLGINKPKSEEINVDQSAINPEKQAAKQMIDAQRKPYIKLTPDPYLTGFKSNGWYTPLNWTEDLGRSIYQANKGIPRYLLDNKVYDPFYKEMPSNELPQYNIGQNALNPIDNLPFPRWLSIPSPATLLPSPHSPKRQSYTIGEPMRYPGRYITYDRPTFDVSGTFNPKLTDAKVGAGALTGLGLTAYPFLSREGEDEVPSENAYIEASQTQAKPTLEQQYASQPIPKTDSGIWGERLNKLAHLNLKDFISYSAIVPLSPFLNKEAFHQPQTVSSNFNDLVKSIYGETPAVPSELPANIPQDNFVAPKELPAEGQTLDDYNRGNQPQEGVVLASQDTGPRVLNAPTEKKAVVARPVQSRDRLTEANLASAMVNKAVSPQVLQYGSPYYLQENKPVDMRQWVRQKYGMSMSPAEMVQRGIMPYEYLQYW